MTITGANFPASLTKAMESSVTLEFSDSTKCIIQSVSTTEITCEVQPFKSDVLRRRNLQTFIFIININGIEFTIPIDFSEIGYELVGISPTSASPIRTELITL